jgi:hypothetical protein
MQAVDDDVTHDVTRYFHDEFIPRKLFQILIHNSFLFTMMVLLLDQKMNPYYI